MPRPFLAVIITTLLLCSCSSKQLQSPDQQSPHTTSVNQLQWLKHQQTILAYREWELFGKIGLRSSNAANSANFKWWQQDATFNISLFGPFGKGAAQLTGTADQVSIKIAGQGEFQTDRPEQLFYQQTGWHIPVGPLHHWVRGLPAPDIPASYELDEHGRLSRLVQAQWQLKYESYQQQQALWLPKKIRLQQNDVKLTFIIKGWLHPEHPG